MASKTVKVHEDDEPVEASDEGVLVELPEPEFEEAPEPEPEPEPISQGNQQTIRYIGMADVRIMTKADLEALGILSDHDMKWSKENDNRVVAQDLTSEDVDRLLALPEFVLATV